MPEVALVDQIGFVGRATELGRLEAALTSARAGSGRLVLVGGEAGIGKSRLVHEFTSRLGVPVLRAACADDVGAPAFGPWTQLLRPLVATLGPSALDGLGAGADEIRRLVGEVGDPDPGAVSRFRLFDSVGQVLERATAGGALVAVVEDVHWADSPSLLLLHHIAAQLPGLRLLVVATYRTDEAPAELTALLRASTAIDLAGLRGDDVAALLTGVASPAPTPRTVATLESRTGGNPYFLIELARLLDAESRGTEGRLPPTVTSVVERRLARLPAPSVDLLGTAAVIGPDVSVALLAEVSGLAPTDVLNRLEAPMSAGLVALATPGTVSFAHALVREALYASLGPVRRIAVHRRVGLALEAGDGDAAALAYHWSVAATDSADAHRAIDHVRRAAERALAMLGYEEAADLYDRCLALLTLVPNDPALRAALLLGRGDALLRCGAMPDARAAYDEVAALARQAGNPDLLAQAALGFSSGLGGFEVRLGDRHQADLLEEALAALPASHARRPLILARLAVALSLVDSQERQLALADEAVTQARELGDPVALAQALAAHCDAISGPAYSERRLAEATEVIELARASGSREQELLGRRLRFVALLELGDPEAWNEAAAYGRVADEIRQPLYSWYVPLWQATRALASGNAEKAERRLEEAMRLGELAHSENALMLTQALQMVILRTQGRAEEILGHIDTMHVPVDDMDDVLPEFAMVLAEAGRLDEARSSLERAGAVGYWRWDDAERLPALTSAAQAAHTLGDTKHAENLLPLLLPWGHRQSFEGIGAGCYGAVSRYIGRLFALLGRHDEAVPFFEDAVERNQHAGMPISPTLRALISTPLSRARRLVTP